MDDDALVSSLREQIRAQGELIADQASRLEALEAVLAMFDARIGGNEARLAAIAKLAELATAEDGVPVKCRRDRHGLRALGVGAAGFLVTGRWWKARRLVAAGLLAGTAATTAAAGPAVAPLPDAYGPAVAAVWHPHDRDPLPVQSAPGTSPGRVVLDADRADPDCHRGVRRTSCVRNPGPRRDAGNTTTEKHALTRARRTDRGRAPNSSSEMPAWVRAKRAPASAAVSSRTWASRASTDSKRPKSKWRGPRVWSVMASSMDARSAARARSSAARPGAEGMRPGGFAGLPSRRQVRTVTYASRCSSLRNTWRHPGSRHPYRAAITRPVRPDRYSGSTCMGPLHAPHRAMPDSR